MRSLYCLLSILHLSWVNWVGDNLCKCFISLSGLGWSSLHVTPAVRLEFCIWAKVVVVMLLMTLPWLADGLSWSGRHVAVESACLSMMPIGNLGSWDDPYTLWYVCHDVCPRLLGWKVWLSVLSLFFLMLWFPCYFEIGKLSSTVCLMPQSVYLFVVKYIKVFICCT